MTLPGKRYWQKSYATLHRQEEQNRKRKGERYLKPSAPQWHTSLGDIEKLARTINDAMTGIAFHDDKQVSQLQAEKLWADRAGVSVSITKL